MPFGSITTNSKTFNETQPGYYQLSTLAFGDPDNSIVVRGAVKGAPLPRVSVTRSLGKNLTIDGKTVPAKAAATFSFVVPPNGFTAAELATLRADLDGFLTEGNISAMLLGRS